MKYSVVVPLKDEENNIEDLYREIKPVMESLGEKWELICIDDGSTDGTLALLNRLKKEDSRLRIISFKKNYGQSSAFDAGFKAAIGKFVITMDGDRQNDPADILKMVPLTAYADLICGERLNRRDPWTKKIISFFANGIRSRVCKDGIKDTGCSLKIYRRSCLERIPLYEGMHRFLPALFLIHGYQVRSLPVNHRERTKGKSKYNLLNRSFNPIFDMFAVWWMRKRHLSYEIDRKKCEGT